MKHLLLILTFAATGRMLSQNVNYVNNPSFEKTLPNDTAGGWDKALYWSAIDTTDCAAYILATKKGGTVPYIVGFQWPRSGDNYALTQFYCSTCPSSDRGYPRNRLKQSLKPNTSYCARYFIVNTNNCVVGIDSYGAYFSGNILDTSKTCLAPIVYLSPQIQYTNGIITDTLNWISITGTFVASGMEKYMLLGNFNSNANTNTVIINPTYLPGKSADVLIDDVSLIELNLPAFAGRDTSITPGDSVFLGREPEFGLDELCTWYKLPSNTAIDTIAGFWVNPVSTSTYMVRQEICGNVKWDTVTIGMNLVGMRDVGFLQKQINLWPSPADDKICISAAQPGSLSTFQNYLLFNTTSEVVLQNKLSGENSFEIDVSWLPNGVYFLDFKGEYVVKKRVVVHHR